ncbi:MAG: Fic family protein [Parabacteroides sp.]|nr:Fic family protein [Parabacteroides sp.]
MKRDCWPEIEEIYRQARLIASRAAAGEENYLHSIVAHSAAIAGSTLTEAEMVRLFETSRAIYGKPDVHHRMSSDLKKAYRFALQEAQKHRHVSSDLLRELNARVMQTTGFVCNPVTGAFTPADGSYRQCAAAVGIGRRTYMNYHEIPGKINELCRFIEVRQRMSLGLREQYELSFHLHLTLSIIHPWLGGNGCTARLAMNYLQFGYGLFPVKINAAGKEEYIFLLQQAQKKGTNRAFFGFMSYQLKDSLCDELEKRAMLRKRNPGF